ncbi:hypothetical protein KOR42_43550 [Thalassoglobus neptunius]|uniref:Uncharacterized protein n=1 Tax=Thalassoglobus neptunius TaxID=1938619 RepID=A0A5C5W5Y0_9PLAN|nr:hypothetical protein KOR42_43550 [Thalassoglobus neptunius]
MYSAQVKSRIGNWSDQFRVVQTNTIEDTHGWMFCCHPPSIPVESITGLPQSSFAEKEAPHSTLVDWLPSMRMRNQAISLVKSEAFSSPKVQASEA